MANGEEENLPPKWRFVLANIESNKMKMQQEIT